MKTFLKTVLGVFSLILLLFFIDLYIFRGYYSAPLAYKLSNREIKKKEITSKNLSLIIDKKDNLYHITFKNNSIKPFLVWTYRWNVLFPINDSIFSMHYRLKADFPKYKNKYHYGLDCGTGAGEFSINPLESFHKKINHQELVNFFNWKYYHQNKQRGDTIMDLIYDKPLLLTDRDKKFKIYSRNDLSSKDSVNIKFYIPVFSYDYKNLMYVTSNTIKISYVDIIKNLIEKEKRIHNKHKNF